MTNPTAPAFTPPISDLGRLEQGLPQTPTSASDMMIMADKQSSFQFLPSPHHQDENQNHHHLDQNQNRRHKNDVHHYQNDHNQSYYQQQQQQQPLTMPSEPTHDQPHRPIMPLTRQRSFRDRLSRTFSNSRRRFEEYNMVANLKSSSSCNPTACAIAVCFAISLLALIIALYTAYIQTQYHGFGPTAMHHGADSNRQHTANLPNQMITPVAMSGSNDVDVSDHEGDVSGKGGHGRTFAHIVGNGDDVGMNDERLERLLVWKENGSNNVDFEVGPGQLKIRESGDYYVYSQVYFLERPETATGEDGEKLPMFFSTNLNDVVILESAAPFKEFSTKYHGAVFHLNEGDRISVSLSNDKLRVSPFSSRTYFGLFMINSS